MKQKNDTFQSSFHHTTQNSQHVITKSKGRGLSYSPQETNDLLQITREHLPIGQEEWEAVCTQHLIRWPDSGPK